MQHLKNKVPAFTLIETVVSLIILLLICQLALFSLQTGKTLTKKVKTLNEDPGIGVIQLEQFLSESKLAPTANGAELIVDHSNGKRYKMRHRDKPYYDLSFGNAQDQGYMPLFLGIRNVSYTYEEPLLTMRIMTTDTFKYSYYYFLIDKSTEKQRLKENKTVTTHSAMNDDISTDTNAIATKHHHEDQSDD